LKYLVIYSAATYSVYKTEQRKLKMHVCVPQGAALMPLLLTTTNGGTFTSSSGTLSSQSRYSTSNL